MPVSLVPKVSPVQLSPLINLHCSHRQRATGKEHVNGSGRRVIGTYCTVLYCTVPATRADSDCICTPSRFSDVVSSPHAALLPLNPTFRGHVIDQPLAAPQTSTGKRAAETTKGGVGRTASVVLASTRGDEPVKTQQPPKALWYLAASRARSSARGSATGRVEQSAYPANRLAVRATPNTRYIASTQNRHRKRGLLLWRHLSDGALTAFAALAKIALAGVGCRRINWSR